MKRQAQGPLETAPTPGDVLKRLKLELGPMQQKRSVSEDAKTDALTALQMLLKQSSNAKQQQQEQQQAAPVYSTLSGFNFDMLRSVSSASVASSASNCSSAMVQMPSAPFTGFNQQPQQQQQQQQPSSFFQMFPSMQSQAPPTTTNLSTLMTSLVQPQFNTCNNNNNNNMNMFVNAFVPQQQQPQQPSQLFNADGLAQLAQLIQQQQQQQPIFSTQMPIFVPEQQPQPQQQHEQLAVPRDATSLVSKVSLPSRRVRQKPSNFSRFRGVYRQKGTKPWAVRVTVDDKVQEIGQFSSEVEAALAFDHACVTNDLDRSLLNFPESVALEEASKDSASSVDSSSEPGSPDASIDSPVKLKRNMPSSNYRGVCWNKCNKSWKASIKVNGKNTHIGYFDNMHEAALAYDLKAIEVRGSRAVLNFQHPKLSAAF